MSAGEYFGRCGRLWAPFTFIHSPKDPERPTAPLRFLTPPPHPMRPACVRTNTSGGIIVLDVSLRRALRGAWDQQGGEGLLTIL
jgi:hypothetical protein